VYIDVPVVAARLPADGGTWSLVTLQNAPDRLPYWPSIVADPNGNAMVAWIDERDTGDFSSIFSIAWGRFVSSAGWTDAGLLP
jgi:hypothetical protein